jgi:hypothetical protein
MRMNSGAMVPQGMLIPEQLPPTSVSRLPSLASYSGFQPLQAPQIQNSSNVVQLEQQLCDFRTALVQTQERSAAMVLERDQRLSMQDRLVDDLRQAIDSQRLEAEELRRHQTELLFTNQEQARRLADLESLLHDMQPPSSARGQQRQQRPQSGRIASPAQERSRVREKDRGGYRDRGDDQVGYDDFAPDNLALQPIEPIHHGHNLLGGDKIDLSLQEFFDTHPGFDIGITKHKPGWYTFDAPIKKKVYMKVVGENVIVRAGGGHVALHDWLEQYWLRARKD